MKIRKSLIKRSEANKPIWERGANEEQLQVIRHETGPARVLAAAGSGKTRATICRIARLVEHANIPGSRICAMTFAKKAGDEMTKRLEDMGIHKCRVGTWHSLCLQILRQDRTKYADWVIEDSAKGTNTRMVLKDVLGFKGMKWDGADVNAIQRFISVCKANLWHPGTPEAEKYSRECFNWGWQRPVEAFFKYNEALAERGILSFDDYLVFTAQHLEDENNRKNWASKFDFLLCDEVQDNNGAQEQLSFYLAGEHQNYMVVGDISQSIYSFRGSSPEFLANFEKYWPGAKTFILPRNYRSSRKIVEVANKIIEKAKLPPMIMVAERKEEGLVRVLSAESLDDEANQVVKCIADSVDAGDSRYEDHTVLYRTNAQSRGIEEALLIKKIPYIVVGGVSFYERKEVRDLLAYLRLAAGKAKVDDVKRSINTPFRFLGNAFVDKLMDEVDEETVDHADWPLFVEQVAARPNHDGKIIQARQRDSAMQWAEMIRSMQTLIQKGSQEVASENEKDLARPSSLLEFVIRQTGYIDYINREEGSENADNSGAANVREMVRVAERFQNAHDLLRYIDKTIRQARKQREDKQAGGQRVLLMSAHRAKGLEWPYVYVIGMNEMLLPHVRGDFEEERRLAYVAVTRARDVLTMSYVRRIATRAGLKDVNPSPFLVDTGMPLDIPVGKVDDSQEGDLNQMLGVTSTS